MIRYDMTFETAVFGCNRWDLGGGLTRLLLSGDLDVAAVDHFQEVTRRLMQRQDCLLLEVDLARVEFMDSAGLASLVTLYHECREAGCQLLFTDDTGRQAQLFALAGLDHRLPFATPQLPPHELADR